MHVNDVVEGLRRRRDAAGCVRLHLPPGGLHTGYATRLHRPVPEEAKGAVRVNYVPRTALLAAGAVLDLVGGVIKRNLPLTRYRVRSIKELTFDCSAARRHLGWEPIAANDYAKCNFTIV